MNRHYNNAAGSTLVELMVALAIIGIIATPLLGMMVHFSKVNRMSNSILYANWTVNNEYELLKGLQMPELLQRWSGGMVETDGFFVSIDLDRYEPGYPIGQGNSINLFAKTDPANNLFCGLITNDLSDYFDITGLNVIKLDIENDGLTPDDSNIKISISNTYDSSNDISIARTSQEPVILNLYTQGITGDHKLELLIHDELAAVLIINVFERPYQYGNTFIKYKDLVYSGNQQLITMVKDEVSLHTYKTTEPADSLIYGRVSLFENLTDDIPVAYREGIIKIIH